MGEDGLWWALAIAAGLLLPLPITGYCWYVLTNVGGH